MAKSPPTFRPPGHEPSNRNKLYDKRRGSSTKRGYDRPWQRLRAWVLRREPLCRPCKKAGKTVPAVEVDHIKPISEAPELRLVASNLQPMCKSCHSAKTMRELNSRFTG